MIATMPPDPTPLLWLIAGYAIGSCVLLYLLALLVSPLIGEE